MKLYIKTSLQKEDKLKIEFNNQIKELTSENDSVEFEFENKGEYLLRVFQEKEDIVKDKFDIWFNVLTWLLRGIFNIILMNTEDKEWVNNSNPVCIRACTKLQLNSSDNIFINYRKSTYDRKTKILRLPSLIIGQHDITNIQYIANQENVKKHYNSFMLNSLSGGTIVIFLVSILTYLFILDGNLELIIFSVVILCALILLIISSVYVENRKLKELKKKLMSIE